MERREIKKNKTRVVIARTGSPSMQKNKQTNTKLVIYEWVMALIFQPMPLPARSGRVHCFTVHWGQCRALGAQPSPFYGQCNSLIIKVKSTQVTITSFHLPDVKFSLCLPKSKKKKQHQRVAVGLQVKTKVCCLFLLYLKSPSEWTRYWRSCDLTSSIASPHYYNAVIDVSLTLKYCRTSCCKCAVKTDEVNTQYVLAEGYFVDSNAGTQK